MALSGSKTVNFCSRNGANRYYLKWTWSATQSIANNQSTVTVKLYIGSYGNGYGISSSATKSGSITIDGTTYNFTNTCGISSGGSKLLATKSKTITHASDGTKTFSINASFNPAVTISGTYQGNVTMGATSYTLNTIARASTISCNGKWTFPGNHTISISRKSSSFTHTVRLYVKDMSTPLKTWTKTSSTSFSTSFSTSENTTIASRLGTASATPSVATKIEVDTYNGSTKIGSTESISGTCTATTRSTTTFTNNFNIGATVSGKITENNGAYTHSINISDASGTWIADILVNDSKLDWSFNTSTIASQLYAKTPNSNTYTGKIKLYTKYNGVQVGSIAQSNWTWKVTNSNPTFNPTLSYSDTNTTTTNITGSAQYIVQNKSTLRVVCTGNATALNSATMKTIQCTVAGVTKSQNYSSSATSYTFDFGTINASSNQSAVVQAIDSRGNKTSKTIAITCLPYTAPKLTAKIERANKFSTTVNVNAKGTYSALKVNGNATNGLNTATYTYTKDSASTGTTVNITTNASNGSFNATQSTFTLAETSIASVQVVIIDRLGGTATATISVPTGLPIMFIDAEKGNMSFNALPDMTKENNMQLGMTLDCAKNQYWGITDSVAGTTHTGKYGINMQNSDLTGCGGIFFNDVCEPANTNEGIIFINGGNGTTACNGQNANGVTRMYCRDGQLWIGNTNNFRGTSTVGSGMTCIGNANGYFAGKEVGMYMTASHTVTPNIALTNCSIGWVLAWSDYDKDTSTKNNSDWGFTLIPKQVIYHGITGYQMHVLGCYLSEVESQQVLVVIKKLKVTNTTITGHLANDPSFGNQHDVVLRYVFCV